MENGLWNLSREKEDAEGLYRRLCHVVDNRLGHLVVHPAPGTQLPHLDNSWAARVRDVVKKGLADRPERATDFYTENALFCMGILTASETDHEVGTARGIGRMTGLLPRVVTYFDWRKVPSNLWGEMEDRVFYVIRSGYDLAVALEIKNEMCKPPVAIFRFDMMLTWSSYMMLGTYFHDSEEVAAIDLKVLKGMNYAYLEDELKRLARKRIPLWKKLPWENTLTLLTGCGYVLRKVEIGYLRNDVQQKTVMALEPKRLMPFVDF